MRGAEALERSNSPTPRLDAEVLLAHALDMDRLAMLLDLSAPVLPSMLAVFEQSLVQRASGSPVAYMTGTAEFWSLTFAVSPAVLIPRPDSEILVQAALDMLSNDTDVQVADLGTGSGCIALSLLSERGRASAFGIDVSHDALMLAKQNAQRLALAQRFCGVEADMQAWLQQAKDLDMIVSNPPYIKKSEIADLPPSVRAFEPVQALDGGADGLQYYRLIAEHAAGALRKRGALALEIGFDQAPAVCALLRAGFEDIDVHKDLAGHPRVITACLKAKNQ